MVGNEQWYSSSFLMEVTTVTNIDPFVKFIVLISLIQGEILSLRIFKTLLCYGISSILDTGTKAKLFLCSGH